MLRGFGLDLTRRADDWQPGDMHEQTIFTPHFIAELTQRLEERLRFDVSHGAANFEDDDFCAGFFLHESDAAFDLIRDVRNDLNGPAEIIATAFLRDNLRIDLPRCEVADPAQADVDEAFVVTQIKVCFGAVIKDIYLAMLIW